MKIELELSSKDISLMRHVVNGTNNLLIYGDKVCLTEKSVKDMLKRTNLFYSRILGQIYYKED